MRTWLLMLIIVCCSWTTVAATSLTTATKQRQVSEKAYVASLVPIHNYFEYMLGGYKKNRAFYEKLLLTHEVLPVQEGQDHHRAEAEQYFSKARKLAVQRQALAKQKRTVKIEQTLKKNYDAARVLNEQYGAIFMAG